MVEHPDYIEGYKGSIMDFALELMSHDYQTISNFFVNYKTLTVEQREFESSKERQLYVRGLDKTIEGLELLLSMDIIGPPTLLKTNYNGRENEAVANVVNMTHNARRTFLDYCRILAEIKKNKETKITQPESMISGFMLASDGEKESWKVCRKYTRVRPKD